MKITKTTDPIGLRFDMEAQIENNIVDHPDVIAELKDMLDDSIRQVKRERAYNAWCYSNLRITKLEKVFFSLYARHNHKNKTKLLRTYIRACMRRNPDMVEEAKSLIDDGSFEHLMRW